MFQALDEPLMVFSASDVEKYGYCPLTWWLSRSGLPEEGEELELGRQKHEAMATEVASIDRHEQSAKESETTILYFAVAATIVGVLGVSFVQGTRFEIGLILNVLALIWLLASVYFLYRAETVATPDDRLVSERVILIFAMVATVLAVLGVSLVSIDDRLLALAAVIVALVWLIGASFFLSRSLTSTGAAARVKTKYNVEKVDYVDEASSKPKLFESKAHGLRGRPDYVVLEEDLHIPVEVKTGRTPRGPLFSHILQVAAYCLLLEEEYGVAPPHGIIRYEQASFDIEYNEDTKQLVIQKLAEMRAAIQKGEAHRNHNRPGKCRNCSRRNVCPERLA